MAVSMDDARLRRQQGGRVPPHNLEAEESLLGAMLLTADAVAAVVLESKLTAADFYRPAHGHIFDAICKLYGRAEAIDPVTVAEELRRADLLDLIGGVPALLSLESRTPATSNVGRYARIVFEHSLMRRLIEVGGQISEKGYDLPDDVEAAIDEAEGLLFALAEGRRARTVEQLGPTLVGDGGWLDRLEERIESGDPIGTPTGWHDLDELLLGLRPGQLVTVAGRPGMGKTAFGAALSTNVAADVGPVLMVSVEMSLTELQDRFVASRAKIDLQYLRSARVASRDLERVTHAVDFFTELPLYIEDDPAATIMTIRATARRIAARHGGLALIVVDYLQLLTASLRRENREREVADLSAGLKRVAREMQVPVVALAQLNRGVENRADKRPNLADLRESGAIENDSDVVAFLFRSEYYDPTTQDRGIAEVIVAKQRNGPTDTVRLGYEARYGTFNSLVRT